MDSDDFSGTATSRRDFLRAAGLGAIALGLGANADASAGVPAAAARRTNAEGIETGAYNILFILVDQERFFRPGELPTGYRLPAHERLMKQGTTFVNHRINSCVCTPSRSVVYTGQHIQQTGMFDNTNFPWIESMSTEIPTLGHMLRDTGYYTAYKGKWHLTKEFETVNKLGTPTKIFTQEMEAYGFSDYFGIGDIIAHTQGGYLHDGVIAAMGGSWLRGKGRELSAEGKPWFLAINLVNPHDVMFYDTDAPGTVVQAKRGITHVARDPIDPLYATQWDFQLPASHFQAIDAPGRPLRAPRFPTLARCPGRRDSQRGASLAQAPQLLSELSTRCRSQYRGGTGGAGRRRSHGPNYRDPDVRSWRPGWRPSAPCQRRVLLPRAEPCPPHHRSSGLCGW